MKNLFAAIALAAVCAAGSAGAAQLFYIPGQNYDEMVHNDQQADGNPVTLLSHPGLYDVKFTADATIFVNGNGYAQQDGPYNWITIDPLAVGFTKMGFTIYPDLRYAGLNGNPTVTFDLLVNFLNAPSQTLHGTNPSNGKVDVWAQGTEVMDSVKIFNLSTLVSAGNGPPVATPLRFEGIKHVSFDVGAAVPEPGTWALMIIGFGGVGAMMRHRRHGLVAI